MSKVSNDNTVNIGVYIGRFQPFHIGHQAIVNEIIADGKHPLIIIGSANQDSTTKNPYSFKDRVYMIKEVYPYACVRGVDDIASNEAWVENLITTIYKYERDLRKQNIYVDEDDKVTITIYYTRKPEDTVNGEHYIDWLMEALDDFVEFKESVYTKNQDIMVSGTEIRKDLEANKHWLDGRIYQYIKDYTQ